MASPTTIVLGEMFALELALDAEGSFEETAAAIELSGLALGGSRPEDSLARAAVARQRMRGPGL